MGQFISNFYGRTATYLQDRQDKLKKLTSHFSNETWEMVNGQMAVSMTDWKRQSLPAVPGRGPNTHTSLYDLFLEAGYTKDDIEKINRIVTVGEKGLILKILKGEKVCSDPNDTDCKLSVKNLFAFRKSAKRVKKSAKKTKKSTKKTKKSSKKTKKSAKKVKKSVNRRSPNRK